ncbi:unnamed protein product [Toxocara canis]|uniref:ADH_zinc_N domain-containing protein n=1 Tax=Toxocara canis TaxID=6265 RepID=A0A183UBW0_TOXCA|nr:unnamed protein product [Toxocara canis]
MLPLDTWEHRYVIIDSFEINEGMCYIVDRSAWKGREGFVITRYIRTPFGAPEFSATRLFLPKELKTKEAIDSRQLRIFYSKVVQSYKRIMVAAPFALKALGHNRNSGGRLLVIGLWGASISNFIHFAFPEMKIVVLAENEQIRSASQKYFGLIEDGKHRVHVGNMSASLNKLVANGRSIIDRVIFIQ